MEAKKDCCIMTQAELIIEMKELQQELNSLETSYDKKATELAFQNREKEKRANELIIANKELSFQNQEKEKRAAELIIANKELSFQNKEKEKRANELIVANKELAFQNKEKEKRAKELIVANKELAFQNKEKEKRAKELIVANKELVFQNREKEKRADELMLANKELAFQNKEKGKRAAELVIVNKEIARKIKERKHTKESLKDSLSFIEATLVSTHDGMLVVNRQGAVVESNAQFAEMWHIPGEVLASGEDKILLESILEQLADPDGFVAKVSELYRKPKSESLDLIFFKDGRVFERISKPIYLEGKAKGRVWSFLDITERKQLEKDLKEISQRLMDVQSIASVGSWETDLSNNEVKWSEETFRIFGLDPSEFKKNHPNFLEYVHPEDLARVDAAFHGSLKTHLSNTVQHRIITPDGDIKVVVEHWRIVHNAQGTAIRALGSCLDITERKQAEAGHNRPNEKDTGTDF